jgi:hypothetical protein
MPIRKTKELLAIKPVSLSETAEHRIHTRKWWAIVILVVGGVMLAGKLPVPYSLAYLLLLFGHLGMLHTFYDKRDIPMMVVNAVWVLIDAIGMYRWFNH